MSAPQNRHELPLATIAQIDEEQRVLKEGLRQRKEEIQRLEQQRQASVEELQRLQAERQRFAEESLRYKAELLRLRRERDSWIEHIRRDELRLYKSKSKELSRQIGRTYLEAIRFALRLRRQPKSIMPRENVTNFISEKIIPLEAELLGVASRVLKIKAEKLGIEINSNPDWWNGNNFEELSATGRTKVAKLVREERRRNIEWWVKVLVPIAAAMISLLSLLIALITVSKK